MPELEGTRITSLKELQSKLDALEADAVELQTLRGDLDAARVVYGLLLSVDVKAFD
jgi:hypothetical protein